VTDEGANAFGAGDVVVLRTRRRLGAAWR